MVYHSGPSWECSVIFLFLHAQDININIPKPISSTPTNQPIEKKNYELLFYLGNQTPPPPAAPRAKQVEEKNRQYIHPASIYKK